MTARSIHVGLAALASLTLTAFISSARADEIQIRGGGRINGIIVERTDRAVVVETGPGRVTLPMSRVERIVSSRSPIEIWRERSAGLDLRDARGWASLGRWAEDAGLGTQAAEAWQHVLAVDPLNPEANRGLGHVQVNGAWLEEDEAYRARGYVRYDDRWVTPAEHDALVRERAADDAADQARAEARAREAEARAREAEAQAAQADAAASMAGYGDGSIPLWLGGGYGYGMGGYGGYGFLGRRGAFGPHAGFGMRNRPLVSPHVVPHVVRSQRSVAPQPQPATTTPPRSVGAIRRPNP